MFLDQNAQNMTKYLCKNPSIKDVFSEGEGGGTKNSIFGR